MDAMKENKAKPLPPLATDVGAENTTKSALVSWIEPDDARELSARTTAWMNNQIVAFALVEDLCGIPCPDGKIAVDNYIAKSAPRIREAIVHGLQKSEIDIHLDYISDLSKRSASEALIIRSFKEARARGLVSQKELRNMPLYRAYKEYFNNHRSLANAALEALLIAEIVDNCAPKT
jgi:hypothetical protein